MKYKSTSAGRCHTEFVVVENGDRARITIGKFM